MTSNGFVIASCYISGSAVAPEDNIVAKVNIEVNAHSILSLTKQSANGGATDIDASLCFPVKKGDTVFVSAHATHNVGDGISGDVSATFFPCL